MTMMMWFLLFRLFLSTLISGPSDLGGTRGQDRRAIALPHSSDFYQHRSTILPFKAFDNNFILSLICRSSNGPDQLTPTLLTYLYSNTFFMGEFSIFFFHPPLQNFRLSANNGFSNKKQTMHRHIFWSHKNQFPCCWKFILPLLFSFYL